MSFSRKIVKRASSVSSMVIGTRNLTREKWEELAKDREELRHAIEKHVPQEYLEEILGYIQQYPQDIWNSVFRKSLRKKP